MTRLYVVSLPGRYGYDAADRFPPELKGSFEPGQRGAVDVTVDAAGLDWLRGDAALYADPNYFEALDLPPGLRAAAKVSQGRLADPAEYEGELP